MLWKKSWSPKAVLLLLGGITMSLFFGSIASEFLRRAQVAGFKTPESSGSVLAATLCLHGAILVLGTFFLKSQNESWRDALGWRDPKLQRHLLLAFVVLLVALPVMLGLKFLSEICLREIGWPVADQRAVEMFTNIHSLGLRVYLGFFAVVIAPVAEEFLFRGVLFSAAKKIGWPKSGLILTSLLFAFIHNSAPIFVPLFMFALALTWLYQKTEGLAAPIVAHSLFNATNLGLLVLQNW